MTFSGWGLSLFTVLNMISVFSEHQLKYTHHLRPSLQIKNVCLLQPLRRLQAVLMVINMLICNCIKKYICKPMNIF